MVEQSGIPVLERQRQEDHEFKVVLGYTTSQPGMLEILSQKWGEGRRRKNERKRERRRK